MNNNTTMTMPNEIERLNEGSGHNNTGSGSGLSDFDEFNLGEDLKDAEATKNNFKATRNSGDHLLMQKLPLLFTAFISLLVVKVQLC